MDNETVETENWIAEILDVHFEPAWGAPYWLRKAKELPFDPRRELQTLDDLARLGSMDLDALSHLPVEDFIPRVYHNSLHKFITSETGGTSGPPKRTAFSREDFFAAFVEPFLVAAHAMHFPKGRHWLYIGPSGPHIIGKAARACAVEMGSIDPFTVDFDPRWVNKLPAESMARARYLEHVLVQAEAILETQEIGVLFSTPPVLTVLAERLEDRVRDRIEGIHLGGLPGDRHFWEHLCTDWFPNAVAISGYGNSLAGMCPQLDTTTASAPEYYPHGTRLILDVATNEDGGRGQVIFHRLDKSCFLPNVHERDEAEQVKRVPAPQFNGFQTLGIKDPRSPDDRAKSCGEGLY